MRAYLELVECSGEATCSLAPGQRFALRPDRDVVLGRAPDCDIVMRSPGQGGRRNCTIRARGSHHELAHLLHQQAIVVGGQEIVRGSRELQDGVEIVPGAGLRLRYVVDRGEGGPDPSPDAGFDTALAVAGPWIVFDESADGWRCVPVDDPGALPRRLLGVTGPDPLRRWRRALAAGGGTTTVRSSWDDGDRRLVEVDDVAGATFFDLLERSSDQRATLDGSFVAALLRPSWHTVLSSARVDVFVRTRGWCVTFDGDVVFDGFVQAALSGLPHFARSHAVGEELIHVVLEAIHGGAAVPDDILVQRPPLAGSASPAPDVRPLTVLQQVYRWIDTQPPVSASSWRGLLTGLFPARVERERALRERLALLDAATIARLPRR
jgi:hypothetical protein